AAREDLQADRRRDLLPGHAAVGTEVTPGHAALQRAGADGLPGPVQLAQPGVPCVARCPARAETAPARAGPGAALLRGAPGLRGGRADPGGRGAPALPAR